MRKTRSLPQMTVTPPDFPRSWRLEADARGKCFAPSCLACVLGSLRFLRRSDGWIMRTTRAKTPLATYMFGLRPGPFTLVALLLYELSFSYGSSGALRVTCSASHKSLSECKHTALALRVTSSCPANSQLRKCAKRTMGHCSL